MTVVRGVLVLPVFLLLMYEPTRAGNVWKLAGPTPEQYPRVDLTSRDRGLLADIREAANTVKRALIEEKRHDVTRQLRSLVRRTSRIHDRHLHDDAVGKVALTQADVGDFDGARETAHLFFDGTLQGEALMLIDSRQRGNEIDPARTAYYHAQIGDIQGALEATEGIGDTLSRSYILEGMAKQQVATGDIEGALQLANAISDVSILTTTLSIIAWTQTKEDDIPGALKTLEGVADAPTRDNLLVNLAESRARHHNLLGARRLSAAIQDPVKQSSAKRYIEAYSGFQEGEFSP